MNRLSLEQSPYLLQHAHNPVDWYPWGDEAFKRAKNENKPLLVSIGYAACHWCHVMERESFENEATAAYMNEHFVCIKVDREEHPDVDHLYMDAVQAISGSGGWPLNVFVTPDRIPFYGGTYFPPRQAFNRPSWMQVLQRMHEIWTNEHNEVTTQAEQMIQYLRQASGASISAAQQEKAPFRGLGGQAAPWDMDTCRKIAENLLKQADTKQGGFGNAPKFPGTMAISFLLEHYHYTGNEQALQHALHSLDAMTEGGIYDQLGGGFARYATDAAWLVPHFEKMLYDNALLIMSLCDAYSITKATKYETTIRETIAFVERELKDASGGYYSALDADSEGVEGKYYTWTWEEWIAALGQNDEIAAQYFGVSEEGNWEETNILHVSKSIENIVAETGSSIEKITAHINAVKQKLLAQRQQRVRPLTDDKSLLSWNALMNIALSKAGVVLQDDAYLQCADEHIHWMLQAYSSGEDMLHTWKQGAAKIMANLDDYAYLVQALLQLATATGNAAWILQADRLAKTVVKNFSHEEGNFFYYTSIKQTDIPARKVDVYDGATPSANAVMAHNLLLLGLCMEQGEWLERAAYMLQQKSAATLRYAYSFGYWAMLLQRYAAGIKTVVAAGAAGSCLKELQQVYMPHCYIVTSKKEISELPILENKFFEGKLLIFVCTPHACLAPVNTITEVAKLV